MNSRPPSRSQSVGALPREKRHTTSRAESVSGVTLDVRCACQYYQSDSLLPERINPVGSRPESTIGFTQDVSAHGSRTGKEFFVERPGMQYDQLSTKSFNIARPSHPDADKISSKSFAIGSQSVPESSTNKPTVLENQLSVEKVTNKGLVVRSISDATESEPIPAAWHKRAISTDRLLTKSSRMRDPDTISNRSFGFSRSSRTPSKSELFIAGINIPSQATPLSRKSSKAEIPQINFTAPTPVIEMKTPFSVYEEFRKNRTALQGDMEVEEEKENIPTIEASCAPQEQSFRRNFPPDPDQGAFTFTSQAIVPNIQMSTESNVESAKEENRARDTQGTKHMQNNKLAREMITHDVKEFEERHQQFRIDQKEHPGEPQSPKLKRQREVDTDQPPVESKLSVPDLERRPSITRKLSQQFLSLVKTNKPIEMSVDTTEVEGPKQKVLIESPIKTVTATAPTETFSLKVEELDQYTSKCRPPTPAPFRNTQKLKVSNIDLSRISPSVEDLRSGNRAPKPIDLNSSFMPQITSPKPHLYKRSDILRTSQPELSIPYKSTNADSEDEASRNYTPTQPDNLISVPINIPSIPHASDDNNSTYLEENREIQPETTTNLQEMSRAPRDLTQLEQTRKDHSVPTQKQPLVRATSKDRIMQSNLLRRKNYFERSQSQDRAIPPSTHRSSTGDLQSGRMTKTVSFDFNPLQSKLADNENRSTSAAMHKKDWIEKTYFMR